ncbi:sulfatase-like hydrolase/transferase [Candidatus Bathyarchaeota archaeon]|nr:sulfatase-like hydrolase/transferase [Candidatus Bathyarchaeota archaeon]
MECSNIVFIVVDALRKDYAKPLEDALVNLGFVKYERAIAPAPWTLPSHASMLTGLYPILHGAHETKNKKVPEIKLKKKTSLLTIELQELGFKTYLLSANPFINPNFGFIGFDSFYEIPMRPDFSLLDNGEIIFIRELRESGYSRIAVAKRLFLTGQYKFFLRSALHFLLRRIYRLFYRPIYRWPLHKGSKRIIKEFKKIMSENSDERKFILINFMEVHEPYFIRNIFAEEKRNNWKTNEKSDLKLIKKWRKRYSREIEYMVQRLLDLIKVLKGTNEFEKSLIIVTSDHGQLLGEHGRLGHGVFLYDELLRVPLLIKYPKDSEIKIMSKKSEYVSLVKLKQLILKTAKNELKDDGVLCSETVFSECYGIEEKIDELKTEEEKNIGILDKYRIAIYHEDFKGIFNVEDWRFEEIISYNPDRKVTEEVAEELKRKVMKFLKNSSSLKIFKIPKKLRNP